MNDLSIFTEIASANSWGSSESVSGPGSTLDATTSLRNGLEEYLPRLGIRSIVDAPCGDLNWIRHLNYRFDRYIGIDIVPSVIESLRKTTAPGGYHFQVGNIVTDILPAADALLCRDCLVHLPFETTHSALRLWRLAGFRYIMATTFTRHEANKDIRPGDWRPLNLQAAPFNLPAPAVLIPDNDGLGPPFDDKALGIWLMGEGLD
jgi:SAM-dependent methyltransferase